MVVVEDAFLIREGISYINTNVKSVILMSWGETRVHFHSISVLMGAGFFLKGKVYQPTVDEFTVSGSTAADHVSHKVC